MLIGMPLPHDYGAPACSLSRSLEVLGERWTLLLLRDAFYGARRFGDFVDHLGIPRSVLAKRLDDLVEHGVLAKTSPDARGYAEYELTAKGRELWPVIHGLIAWGDAHYAPDGPPRLFAHIEDGGRVGADGVCAHCEQRVDAADLQAVPGPGLNSGAAPGGAVTAALQAPHRLMASVHRS
jgi:DNA-binding HxlR family transcriptional regulator